METTNEHSFEKPKNVWMNWEYLASRVVYHSTIPVRILGRWNKLFKKLMRQQNRPLFASGTTWREVKEFGNKSFPIKGLSYVTQESASMEEWETELWTQKIIDMMVAMAFPWSRDVHHQGMWKHNVENDTWTREPDHIPDLYYVGDDGRDLDTKDWIFEDDGKDFSAEDWDIENMEQLVKEKATNRDISETRDRLHWEVE